MADPQVEQMTERIATRREELGWSIAELHYETLLRLPRSHRRSDETIRRYVIGDIPAARPDLVVLAAVAKALGLDPETMAPQFAGQINQLRTLLAVPTPGDRMSDAIPGWLTSGNRAA